MCPFKVCPVDQDEVVVFSWILLFLKARSFLTESWPHTCIKALWTLFIKLLESNLSLYSFNFWICQFCPSLPPVGLSVSLLSSVSVKLKEDGKLCLLKISKSPNCSSVGSLKCVQFHNWFFGAINFYNKCRTFQEEPPTMWEQLLARPMSRKTV